MNNYNTSNQQNQRKNDTPTQDNPLYLSQNINEIVHPALVIPSHEVKDKKSKADIQFKLKGWQRVELPLPELMRQLELGRTIIPADMKPQDDGTYTHGEKLFLSTRLIAADADNIVGVDFKKDGSDENPDGVKPFTDHAELFLRYPELEQFLFSYSESVSSMSEDKGDPHLRFRLTFLFENLFRDTLRYRYALLGLADKFNIIPLVKRQPAQPVFGNARPENRKVHIVGKIISEAVTEELIQKGREVDTDKKKRTDTTQPEIFQNKQEQTPTKQTDTEPYDGPDITLEGFLNQQNISYEPDTKESEKYFVRCPYGNNHTDGICKPKDSYVFVNDTGKFAYHCSHTSCKLAGRTTWEAFREGYGIPKQVWEPREHRKRTGRIRKVTRHNENVSAMDIKPSSGIVAKEPPVDTEGIKHVSVTRDKPPVHPLEFIRDKLAEVYEIIVNAEVDPPRVDIVKASTGLGKSYGLVQSIKNRETRETQFVWASRNKELRDQQYADCVEKLGEHRCHNWQGRETGFEKIKDKTRKERENEKNFTWALCPMFPEWQLAWKKGIKDYCKPGGCTLWDRCQSRGYCKQRKVRATVINLAIGGALDGFSDFYEDLREASRRKQQALIIDDYTLSDLIIDIRISTKTLDSIRENFDSMKFLKYQPDAEQEQDATDFEAWERFIAALKHAIKTSTSGTDFRNALADYLDPERSTDADRAKRAKRGSRLIFNEVKEKLEPPADALQDLLLEDMPDSLDGIQERLQEWYQETDDKEAIAFEKILTETETIIKLPIKPRLKKIKHLILMSGTTDPHLAELCLPADAKVVTHALPNAPLAEDVVIQQYADAKLYAVSVFDFHENGHKTIREPSEKKLNDYCDKVKEEVAIRKAEGRPYRSLFISYKELNDKNSDSEAVQRVHKIFDEVTHFGASEGLNFDELGILVIYGFPRVKHEVVRKITMHIFGIDIGDYQNATELQERTENTLTETGDFYKDERAHKVYEALGLAILNQSIGRIRPTAWPDTITTLHTAALVEISQHADFYTKSDFGKANSLSGIKAEVIIRETNIEKATDLLKKGISLRKTAEACNISFHEVRELSAELSISETVRGPKGPLSFGPRTPVDNPEKTADETTSPKETELPKKSESSHLESSHLETELPPKETELPPSESSHLESSQSDPAKKHHKDVAGQSLDFLSDGMERKASEIKQAVTASHRAIEKTLKKLVEQGLIIKVRHGTYRIAEKAGA